jgi:hypothetical protein
LGHGFVELFEELGERRREIGGRAGEGLLSWSVGGELADGMGSYASSPSGMAWEAA